MKLKTKENEFENGRIFEIIDNEFLIENETD